MPTGEEIPEIYEAIASESEALRLDMRNVIPIEAEADSGAYFMRPELGDGGRGVVPRHRAFSRTRRVVRSDREASGDGRSARLRVQATARIW